MPATARSAFIFLFFLNFCFAQHSKYEEFDRIAKENYRSFVKKYEDADFSQLQQLILEELNCVKFDDAVMLSLNEYFVVSEGPQECYQDMKYLEASYLEQRI